MNDTSTVFTSQTTFALIAIAVASVAIFIMGTLKRKNKYFKVLYRRYIVQLLQLILIVYCIAKIVGIINPSLNIHSILITGSAIIVAIVGFAAQTAISDILCGFLISIFKPFEIGDRIIIEGMQAGIVEDITLRHIVVGIYDGLKIIVPNSQLNTKTLISTSYHMQDRRGIHLKFSVSYDTDIHKAMDLIRDCVADSPYTLTVKRNGIHEDSGPVYFLEYGASAIILETTIWVTKNTSSYVATTDINLRVHKAFNENGIEIPYGYLNVLTSERPSAPQEKEQNAVSTPQIQRSPSKRYYRTNNLKFTTIEKDMGKAKKLAGAFSRKQFLTSKSARQLELITEETILLIHSLIGNTPTRVWIEGSGLSYRTHLAFDAEIGSDEYKKLLSLSSSGKNEAMSGVAGHIFDAMILGLDSFTSSRENYEWKMDKDNLSQDEISESILASLADEIKVGVTKDYVELTVEAHHKEK
jgi:small-conductance mechanosensitive channel